MDINENENEKNLIPLSEVLNGKISRVKLDVHELEKQEDGITGCIGDVTRKLPFSICDSEWENSRDNIYAALDYAMRLGKQIEVSMTCFNGHAWIESFDITIKGEEKHFG